MSELERLRLSSTRREASALLMARSTVAEQLEVDEAWWTCHDEGDLDSMVSLVTVRGTDWSVRGVDLVTPGPERTDAEALARLGPWVFVFGSSFTKKSGAVDERRAFVARFDEAEAATGTASADVIDLGTSLTDLVAVALAPVDRLPRAKATGSVINVEGAAFVDDDLLIGLRWPVSAEGQPLLVRVIGAAGVLRNSLFDGAGLADLEATVIELAVDASKKRPAGVRGLSVVDGAVHVLVGQTERDLVAGKAKAAAALHVMVVGDANAAEGAIETEEVQSFEGFRKVEGLAPTAGGSWLYALDDEDAIVLLTTEGP